MRTRIRLLIIGLAVVVAVGGVFWYLKIYRPGADVVTNETTQSFVDQAALKGSGENQATLENVEIGSDGTIQLAPAGQ